MPGQLSAGNPAADDRPYTLAELDVELDRSNPIFVGHKRPPLQSKFSSEPPGLIRAIINISESRRKSTNNHTSRKTVDSIGGLFQAEKQGKQSRIKSKIPDLYAIGRD